MNVPKSNVRLKHNYNENATFKIDHIFLFREKLIFNGVQGANTILASRSKGGLVYGDTGDFPCGPGHEIKKKKGGKKSIAAANSIVVRWGRLLLL